MNNLSNKTKRITTCALMTALLCILAPLSVPIGPVPISLTNLVLYLSLFVMGTWDSLISCAIYLLLGAVGLPVFSGYSGGLAKLAGPTGGYLVGFLFMIVIAGPIMEKFERKIVPTFLGMVVGTAVEYALGTAWFVFQADATWAYALSVCVYPFIPFDLGKMVIGISLGKAVRYGLVRSHLLAEKAAA